MDKIHTLLSLGVSIVKAKMFNKKIPLLVGWQLTNRCNLKCKYCNAHRLNQEELPTELIFSIIDELRSLGTKFISFTGGEPLLREDIGAIIDYCKNKAFHIAINSNGFILKEKLFSIKNADLVIMSLDGPEEVHDYIRGHGSYRRVLEAAEALEKEKIRLNFAVTLTKFNSDQVSFLLNKAREYAATITFQPASLNMLYADTNNPMCLSQDQTREIMQELISYKRKPQGSMITNSISTLEHLYYWPNKKKIKCSSGRIACRIRSNADVCLCNRIYNKSNSFNILELGFKKAFDSLPQISCDECWCAQRVEVNLLFNMKWEAIMNNLVLLAKG